MADAWSVTEVAPRSKALLVAHSVTNRPRLRCRASGTVPTHWRQPTPSLTNDSAVATGRVPR